MKDRPKTKQQLLAQINELQRELTMLRAGGSLHDEGAADNAGAEMTADCWACDDLLSSEGIYRGLVESTDDSIYLVDRECRYLYMNRKHLRRLGITQADMLDRTYGDFHSGQETSEFVRYVDDVFLKGESVQREHRSLRDGGYFLWTMSPVRGSDGEIHSVAVVSKNITCLKEMEARLYLLSFSDELTGAYNRRGFLTLADQQIKLARRSKKGMMLIYADLDGLKWINDTYGHSEGDFALKTLSSVMKSSYRDSDIVARIGGDEFVVLITDLLDVSEGDHIERLLENIRKFNLSSPRGYALSVSTGAVLVEPDGSCTVEQLLGRADRIMYEQKIRQKTG
jgi:diguanylate cyclase (GGDEF)-like protein/PAS domain S-box-containing protein